MTNDDEELPSGPGRHPLWGMLGSLLLGVLVLVVGSTAMGRFRAPELPERAPDFRLTTLSGDEVALSELAGRTVVLNFWATWCGPCRIEAPSFAAFAEANPDVVVLGLAEDDHQGLVRRTSAELGITYPVALASDELLAAYGVTTFPTTVVIGADGQVRSAHTGLLTRPQLWAMTR
mgnify:CR=1 FL=1